MRRQQLVLAVVFALAAAVLAAWLARDGPPRRPSTGTGAEGAAALPIESSLPPTLQGPEGAARIDVPPERLRLTFVDVGSRLPAPSLQVEIKSVAGPSEWQLQRTSAEGLIEVESEAPVELRSPDSSYRILALEGVSTAGPGAAGSAQVWIARVLKVRASVFFEGVSEAVGALNIKLTSTCVRRSPGSMDSSSAEPGTHAWLAKHAPAELFRQASARQSPIEYLQLALPDVAVVVGAPGFAPATQIIDFAAIDGSEMDIAFHLIPVRTALVRVTDPEGRPIKKAHVQLIEDREGSPLEVNIYLESALRLHREQAYTVSYSNESARVSHITGARTSAEGTASLPSVGSATRRYVVVWADNHLPYLGRESDTLFEHERGIVLQPLTPMVSAYSFANNGEAIIGGQLNLAESLDGLTPALPTIVARQDGSFPSELIVPGKEYYVVVRSRGGKEVYAGWLRFGAEEVIDTTTMRAE